MKRIVYSLFALISVLTTSAQEFVQPETLPQKPVENTYHGVTLEDPYQYLENLDDPVVVNWMKSNANYANSILDNIEGKQAMVDKMLELMNRTSAAITGLHITDDNTYYYLKRVPGEEIFKMYKRSGYNGMETLFFDPTSYKNEEGKTYTIEETYPNIQGDKVAVVLAANGSENPETLIFNSDGKRFNETIELGSQISWQATGDTFYYTKLNSSDITNTERQMYMQSYSHKVGTDQSEDKLIFSKAQFEELDINALEIPILSFHKELNRNLLYISTVDKNMKTYLQSNSGDKPEWIPLTKPEDKVVDFVANKDNFYFLSYQDAPNYKVLKSSSANPSFSEAEVVVEESPTENITQILLSKDGLYYTAVQNGVKAKVYYLGFDMDMPMKLDLPFVAGDAYLTRKGAEFSDVWITISGWTSPSKRYLFNPKDKSFTYQPLSTPAEYPELKDLVVKEVMVKSHDGVMVPVSIIHNKDLKMDGSTPTVMYSYGSYGISTSPFFSPITLAYTIYGGTLVVPHVRGGGELGDSWHKAGQKLNKPNTWKDAIATAEYLINEGYTSPEKLSFFGGSAGGILVGRSITERPDLFVAAAPMVGAMNTVRMEETPNGPVNTPEFGTIQDPEEFKGLLEMDSYQHLEPGTDYPATLITAGINDPRVIAWQPSKFAAKMQHDQASDAPILFLTDFEGGHGGGVALTQALNNFSNIFSFFYWQSGHPDFQMKENIKD